MQTKNGLTGACINRRKVLAVNLGERDSRFSNTLDNYINILRVNNMLVGPAFDSQGNLRAVVQLLNKKNSADIEDMDAHSLDALLPTIGEILRCADDSLKIMQITAGLYDHMAGMRESI
jgi:hypothetical protein